MPITAAQIATADVATLQQALLEPSNMADAATMAAINAAIAALNVTPPVQQQAPVAGAYNARTRIALADDILPAVQFVALGAKGTASTGQAAAGMVPVMVTVKVNGESRETAATIMNGAVPSAATMVSRVSSYNKVVGKDAQGKDIVETRYSLDVTFGGVQGAVQSSIAQLEEKLARVKLQASIKIEEAKARRSEAEAQAAELGNLVLLKQLED
jgi:hypothetical protein